MKTAILTVATALAFGLAGCDRNPNPAKAPATSSSSPAPTTPQATTPSTPANVGTPSASEKAAGSNPVQGQVDPKESAQRKDFQQPGDSAGPKK